MQTFKKVITAILSFAVMLVSLSIATISPWAHSETTYYQDSKLRKQLSGSIDYIFIGASHGLVTFIPEMADEELNVFSYNLSGSMLPMYSRYYLLKKELARNPVQTVVLEISCDTLTRKATAEYAIGEDVTISRLDDVFEKAEYIYKYTAYDDWLNVYARQLLAGASYWLKRIRDNTVFAVDYSAKGFHGRESMNVSLSSDYISDNYNSVHLADSFNKDEVKKFQDVVDLCKSYNCRVIVVVVPVPDSYIWERDNLDSFYRNLKDFCTVNDIECYDFNLTRDRFKIYDDEYSFSDQDHMSVRGAKAFMDSYCRIMKQVDSMADVSDEFYKSYYEMKMNSPYMANYLEMKN